jgi:hypothetical protein
MITRVRAPGHFGRGGPRLSVTGVVHLQLMRAERAIRGARLHGCVNPRGGVGDPLPQHLAPIAPAFSAFVPEHRAPLRLRPAFTSSPRLFADPHGSPATHHRDRPAAVASLDGDEVGPERAGERRPAGAECGRAARSVDSPAGDGPGP